MALFFMGLTFLRLVGRRTSFRNFNRILDVTVRVGTVVIIVIALLMIIDIGNTEAEPTLKKY